MVADQVASTRYVAVQQKLADKTGAAVARIWDGLDGYNDANVAQFTERAEPVIEGAKQRSAGLTAAYLEAITGEPVEPVTIDLETPWREPFVAYWRHLKNGGRWEESLTVGRRRANALGINAVIRTADQVIKG